MTMSNGGNGLLSDAEAYHDMISAAVDLTNVYSRNGIVTGTFAVVMQHIILSAMVSFIRTCPSDAPSHLHLHIFYFSNQICPRH